MSPSLVDVFVNRQRDDLFQDASPLSALRSAEEACEIRFLHDAVAPHEGVLDLGTRQGVLPPCRFNVHIDTACNATAAERSSKRAQFCSDGQHFLRHPSRMSHSLQLESRLSNVLTIRSTSITKAMPMVPGVCPGHGKDRELQDVRRPTYT